METSEELQPAIKYEVKERIAFITINRPEKLNALNPESAEQMGNAWIRFRDDEDALVAIVSGTGEKAFCVGYEVSPETLSIAAARKAKVTVPSFHDIWKPTIAAITGYCLAGGWWIAQECDIRVAATDAQFGITQVNWGLMPAFTASLSDNLMPGHALELLLIGDRINAKRAYEMGFVNFLATIDQVMPKAIEISKKICKNGPVSVKKAKELFYKGRSLNSQDAMNLTWQFFEENDKLEDCKEGVAAFQERRTPQFKGR